MWFLLALLAWPLVEIGLFIELGGRLGLWPSLALVLASAALGLAVLRREGLQAQSQLRAALNGLRRPEAPLGDGALKMLAGVLLLLPGFLTDALGLLLLLAPLRRLLLRRLSARVQVHGFATSAARRSDGVQVIDGEFLEIEPGNLPPRPPSGWTHH